MTPSSNQAQGAPFFAAPCRSDGARVYDAAGRLVATVAYRRDSTEEAKACALIAAVPDLLAAQTMGVISTPDFLDWLADRLVYQYGENPNVDFVLSLRARAKAGRAAIAAATQGGAGVSA